MRQILSVSAATLMAFSVAFGRAAKNAGQAPSKSSAELQVLDAEHHWVQAVLDGNVEAFAGFMADSYVALLPDGGTMDKAGWVEDLRSRHVKYESVELRDLKVYLHGDTAVVTGRYTQRTNSAGRHSSGAGAYVDTWVRRRSRWLVVASAFVRLPERL